MNISVSQEDLDILTEAKRLNDWRVCLTWKQRFMYQRYVALPGNDMVSVKEIASLTKQTPKEVPMWEQAEEIMNS